MNQLEEDDDGESDFDLEEPIPDEVEDPIPDEVTDNVDIYTPESPELPGHDTGENLESKIGEVDEDTLSAFVTCVVLTNVALFGVSLGALLIVFRGAWLWGGGGVVVGVLGGIRAYQRYREWKLSRDGEATEEIDDSTESTRDIDDSDEAHPQR